MTEARACASCLPNEVIEKAQKAAVEIRQYLQNCAARGVSEIRAIQERLQQLLDVAHAAAFDPSQGRYPKPIGDCLTVMSNKIMEASQEILQSFEEAQDNLNSYNNRLADALRLWEEMFARVRNDEATETSNSTQSDDLSPTTAGNLGVRPTNCEEAADSRVFSKQVRDEVSQNNDLLLSAFGEVTGWWHRFAEAVDVRAKIALTFLAEALQLGDFILSGENLYIASQLAIISGVIQPRLQLVRDLTDAVRLAESSVKQCCMEQFNEREQVSSCAIEAVVALTKAVGGKLLGQDDAGQVMTDESTP